MKATPQNRTRRTLAAAAMTLGFLITAVEADPPIACWDFHGHQATGGVQSGDPANTDGLVMTGWVGPWGTLPAANTSATQRQGTSGAYTFTFNVGGAVTISAWTAAVGTNNVRDDYYYINNPARYSGPVPWRAEGLTPGTAYDIILLGRGGDPDAQVSIPGFDAGNGAGNPVTLDSEGDANFQGVVADGDGYISGFFDTPAGTDAPITGVQIGPSTVVGPTTFKLAITPAVSPATGYDLKWESQLGMLYRVLSNTGLGTPIGTWSEVAADIAATPPTNTYNVNPGDPTLFYAVEEYPAPPVEIFAENFDGTMAGSLPADWTTGKNPADNSSLTNWELGTPANVGPVPPGVPLPSGANCVATNIMGNYDDPVSDLGVAHTDIWLRTPAIDVGTATAGTLTFQQWTQIEDVPGDLDYGSLRILDASDDSELAVMESQSIDGNTTGWEEYSMELPAAAFTAALGTIKVEWQFEADDIDSYAGWYIDDISVTVTGP